MKVPAQYAVYFERVNVRLAIDSAIQSDGQLNDEVDTISQPFFVSLWRLDIPRHTTVLLDDE